MIKIFKAHPMRFTPFNEDACIEYLKAKDIYLVNDFQDCDVVVSITLQTLYKYMLKNLAQGSLRKKYLLWTNEPRDNTCFESQVNFFPGLPPIHIMNIYTGDIWFNNYYETNLGRSEVINTLLQPLDEVNFPDFVDKKIVALMIYRNNQRQWSLKRKGQELDLCYLRTQIGLEGHRLNKIDVYGAGWPEGVALEVSRSWDGKWTIPRQTETGERRNWKSRKAEILENYHFNLCFENTNAPYYCTEKIWDSIRSYCLPIYYGKDNAIYEDFPKNSFLDYCDFNDPRALFDYVDQMTVEEFRERMNRCIDVFNGISVRLDSQKQTSDSGVHEKRMSRIIQRLDEIA